MDHAIEQPTSKLTADSTCDRPRKEAPGSGLAHPVLSRLLEEVRNEKQVEASYDRVHNRHNRG